VDGVQAILIAIQLIGFRVCYRSNGTLQWLDDDNAGFPISFGPQSPRKAAEMRAMRKKIIRSEKHRNKHIEKG